MESVDVCVRGAGAVACALALALSRQGLNVALQGDAAAEGRADDVRAFALNAGSVALLRELKVWDALPADARTPVHDMRVEGDAAGAELNFSAWSQGVEALAWIVDAGELERALGSAVAFAPHVRRVAASAPVNAALLALAEGKHSPGRAQLHVAMPSQPYGQRAVAARLRVRAAARRAGAAVVSLARRARAAALRPAPARSFAGAGVVGARCACRRADGDGRRRLSSPPSRMPARCAAGRLELSAPRAAWPLSLAHAERICGPGWVLLGDAAHVVHPLAGQGLNLGLADVRALAAVVSQREPWRALGDERLLQRYARARAGPTRAMGQLTDGLLQLFASEVPLVRELRNRGLSLVNALPPLKRLLASQALDS